MVTVKVDGKTQSITLEEALQGYQRYSDYSRKTAELSNERRELGKHADAVVEERQTYATMLGALRDQLQALQPQEPNWDEIYRSDPIGYARQRDEWRDKQDKIAAANFELSRLQGLQQKQNAEKLAQIVADGRAKMLDLNPAWRDQKVWESDRGAIVEYARTAGYTPEEIAQAYDPRAIVMFNKARLYDELMAKKPQPNVVRGPRVASAGAAPASAITTRLNAAQQRLAKSGRLDDAAKVFEQII
jgi:DNA repair exonuclease SbcCD ATPase subunit